MAVNDGLTINTREVQQKLDLFARIFPMEAGAALFAEAEIEMTESKRRTPVDTGALRSTGFVKPPYFSSDHNITVVLGFGGPAAPYALIVHEDMEAFHKVGQAKYLESTLMESRPFIAQRIANRLQLDRMAL